MSMDPVRPKLRQVVLDTTNARDAAEFWRELLGLVYRPDHDPPPEGQDDPAGRDWLNLYEIDGALRLDRADDPEEPLRVYTDRDGHTFCVFVA